MNRTLRFHLVSLFTATLTAAILLGFNLMPRITDHKEATELEMISCWAPGMPIIRLPDAQRHSAIVRVSQGWPWTVREEDAVVRVATPIPTESDLRGYSMAVTRWSWSDGVVPDWRLAALNGVAILVAAITLLTGVELVLRRKVQIHSRTTQPCVSSLPAQPDFSART